VIQNQNGTPPVVPLALAGPPGMLKSTSVTRINAKKNMAASQSLKLFGSARTVNPIVTTGLRTMCNELCWSKTRVTGVPEAALLISPRIRP